VTLGNSVLDVGRFCEAAKPFDKSPTRRVGLQRMEVTSISHVRRFNRAAFTLIELLAALAVLSLLVVLLFKAFSSTSGIMIAGSNEMEKNQVVRAVLQQIARDVERTAYSSTAVNMYQATTPSEIIFTGSGISNTTLYCLSALSSAEGNVLGTVVNVGYQMTTTNVALYGGAVGATVPKWVLQRGDDSNVDPNDYPTSWWINTSTNGTGPGYWKILSDNVLGVAFQFYTDPDVSVPNWNAITLPNSLPTSVGITIWAIDSVNYNLALSFDSTFASAPAQRILTNNTHKYTCRVFLPQSTQNP